MDSEKKKKQLIVLFIIGSIIIVGIFIWSMILNFSNLSFTKPDIKIPEIPSNTGTQNQVEDIKDAIEENSEMNTENSTETNNTQ
jgi:ABC-type sugar transport system permease subunit